MLGNELTTLQVVGVTPAGGALRAEALPATVVSASGANLKGRVSGSGAAKRTWFEWGNEGLTQQAEALVHYSTDCGSAVSAALQGLQPDTCYEFRLVASNELGEARSEPLAFTTALRPVITGIATLAQGWLQVDFDGAPGGAYSAWASTNLAEPGGLAVDRSCE